MFGHDLRNKRENAGSMISSAKSQPYQISSARFNLRRHARVQHSIDLFLISFCSECILMAGIGSAPVQKSLLRVSIGMLHLLYGDVA